MQAETRYAKSGDVHIAYQVFGEGPLVLGFHPALFLECRPELDGEVEYDYISLNNTTQTIPAGAAGFAAGDTFNISNRNFSIVEVGMNYKFGW